MLLVEDNPADAILMQDAIEDHAIELVVVEDGDGDPPVVAPAPIDAVGRGGPVFEPGGQLSGPRQLCAKYSAP